MIDAASVADQVGENMGQLDSVNGPAPAVQQN
jgi:hypothetical protein